METVVREEYLLSTCCVLGTEDAVLNTHIPDFKERTRLQGYNLCRELQEGD